MPALKPTDHFGQITWLGLVDGSGARIRATARPEVFAGFAGVEGEAHSGLTRPSGSRVTAQHPNGTEIRNVRQLSIVSAEEMAGIARDLALDALAPEWLGATLVIAGIPDFSHVPPSSRLQTGGGTTLVVDMQNRPCHLPAREIESERPGRGKAFKQAAEGRRGVTAWVEREGPLQVGDEMRLHVPDQRAWQPAVTAAMRVGG